MASTPDVNRWAEITLWAVGCMLEDIHDRAPDWHASPEDEHADIYFEWEGVVDRLHGVIDDDRVGALTDEQRRKLRELAQRLEVARDVILRIGLVYPDLGRLSLVS